MTCRSPMENWKNEEDSYASKLRFKSIFQQLDQIGGKVFREAVNEYIFRSGQANQNKESELSNDMCGKKKEDQLLSSLGLDNKLMKDPLEKFKPRKKQETPKQHQLLTIFKSQHLPRESGSGSETTCRTEEKRANAGIPPPKAKRFESLTQAAIQKINPTISVNLPDTAMPFVAGTSLSQSYNIFLNCQQVLATLKRNGTGNNVGGGGDAEEQPQPVTQGEKIISHASRGPAGDSLIAKRTEPRTEFTSFDYSPRFKAVLKHLYVEFTTMSQEYEKVMQALSVSGMEKRHLRKELKRLDHLLAIKEEEIMVLISMYKELISMKDRVKRAEARQNPNKFRVNQPETEKQLSFSRSTQLRLKFLLGQVKKFQGELAKA